MYSTSMVRKNESYYYLKLIPNNYSNPGKFWKVVKASNSTSPASVYIPTQVKFDDFICDQTEICSGFNRHFIAAGHLLKEDDFRSASSFYIHLSLEQAYCMCLPPILLLSFLFLLCPHIWYLRLSSLLTPRNLVVKTTWIYLFSSSLNLFMSSCIVETAHVLLHMSFPNNKGFEKKINLISIGQYLG